MSIKIINNSVSIGGVMVSVLA